MVKVIFPSQGLVKVFEKQELTKLTLANGHHICQFTIYIYGKILWTHIEMIILNHLVFWHIFWVFFCWPFSYYWTEICHHTLKRFVPTLSCIGWLIYLLVSANNCVRIFKIYFNRWKQTSLYTGFYLKIVLVNNVFNFNLYPQKQ